MTTHDDKQITIDVPADRVPEFYAFFGRFLAAEEFGRRRGRRGGHRHCGHPRHEHDAEERSEAPQAEQA